MFSELFEYLHKNFPLEIWSRKQKLEFNCLANKAFVRYLLASSWKWLQENSDENRAHVPSPRMANNVKSSQQTTKLRRSSISIYFL